jgi:hypothetical protein
MPPSRIRPAQAQVHQRCAIARSLQPILPLRSTVSSGLRLTHQPVQQDVQQQGRTTASMHDRRQPLPAAEVVRPSYAPVVRIEVARPIGRPAPAREQPSSQVSLPYRWRVPLTCTTERIATSFRGPDGHQRAMATNLQRERLRSSSDKFAGQSWVRDRIELSTFRFSGSLKKVGDTSLLLGVLLAWAGEEVLLVSGEVVPLAAEVVPYASAAIGVYGRGRSGKGP